MGTKLCNLHIYNPDKRAYSVAPGYSVVRVADGWDTVYEDEMTLNFNKLAKMAKDLSKELNTPVISVNYFDDDVFELNVNVEGKKAAFYSINYGRVFSKKVPVMVDALRLDDKDAKAFRYLVKKEMTAPEAIDSISAICGLPLYSDMFMYKEMPDKLIPDKEAVLSDIKKEKAKNKISSEKAELLEEFPGAAVFYYVAPSPADNYDGIIRTVEPSEEELDYGRVNCYQIAEGPVPYMKRVYDYYIPIHDYTKSPKNTNIWIVFHQKGSEDMWLDFLEPPAYCHFSTKDKNTIEKINGLGIIPEEKLSNPPYEFGEFFSRIDSSRLPKYYFQDVTKTDNGVFVKRYEATKEKRQGDFIIRPSYYTVYGTGSNEQYARFEFWDSNYELVRDEMIPIDFLKMPFPVLFADFAYIEEKNIVVYGDHVIDLSEKIITIDDRLPDKCTFIEKRTVGGRKLLIIGTSRYVHVFDYDLNRLKSYSIVGKYVNWFFDADDNMYVVTSSMMHGADDTRGMKPEDKVRLYKIHISL